MASTIFTKKTLKMRQLVILIFLISMIENSFSQEIIPFKIRKQESIKGGLKMIGNNILNRDPSDNPYNGNQANDVLTMKYIDIDNQEDTFSSSAATLSFANATCSKIKYAGLYWGAFYQSSDPAKGSVKIKTPSQSGYITITADNFIYDYYDTDRSLTHISYVCYKDVTDLVSQGNPNGEYIVANIKASETNERISGTSAGWVLVILYEDPNENTKNITTFDGYASIFSSGNQESSTFFSFSGFKTLPTPLPVNARLGVVALEGDKAIMGDRLSIEKDDRSFFDLSTPVNPVDNFFNGSISDGDAINMNRRPASQNTLGWDIDLFSIPNSGNSIIKNNQTSAKFKAYTTQDRYDIFFSAFEVEVIEPKINLLKTVEDSHGNILNNSTLPMGSTVYYGLEFQNIGNDNATEYEITDVLPKNVTLDTSSFEIPHGSGITHQISVSNSGETTLTFRIPNNLVEKNGAKHKIRFAVKIKGNCTDFSASCSEKISNKAFSIYKGELNQSIISDKGSFSSVDACKSGTLEETVFFVDISGCLNVNKTEKICGANLILSAENGFDKYVWKDESGDVISRQQTAIIYTEGIFTVEKSKGSCQTRTDRYTVSGEQRYDATPLYSLTHHWFICSTTERFFPQLYLCGENASKTTNFDFIPYLQKVELYRYSGSHSYPIDEKCPPDDSVSWTKIHEGKTISLTNEGIFKLVFTFENQCVSISHFRVHTAFYNPIISKKDIFCGTEGNITITNPHADYQYAFQLDNEPIVYGDNHSVKISKSGNYTVFVRKKNSSSLGCTFRFDNIIIKNFEQKLEILQTQNESCYNQNDGSISFKVSGGKTPYTAVLKNKKTTENQLVTIHTESQTTSFNNLPPSEYELTVSDSESCQKTHLFSVEKAVSLGFSVKNELICSENNSISEVKITFEETNLDLSKMRFSYEDFSEKHSFEKINGNTAYFYPFFPSGTYSLTVFYENCENTQSFDFQGVTPIRIQEVPSFELSTIKIEGVGGSGNYTYFFNGKPQKTPVYHLKYSDEGYKDTENQEVKKINVRIEDDLGCSTERTLEALFYDIRIPAYFSPNGDGIEDTWGIKNALGYPNIRIHIFDKSGRKITTLTHGKTWDGLYNGTPLPAGDYWFQLTFNELRERRVFIGHFTLYR